MEDIFSKDGLFFLRKLWHSWTLCLQSKSSLFKEEKLLENIDTMIVTNALGRNFGSICAVKDLSFAVERGEVLGFLGPNGAGKSTTMKMLTCFLSPSSGTAKVDGFDILDSPQEVRRLIGYLPENAPLYGEMTVLEFLRFVMEVRGLSGESGRSSLKRSVDLTSLGDVLGQKIETLSKGFKRRVGLAQAIIHDPEILILDEPTDGLDPNQKFEVRRLIEEMSDDKCIILSTHILEEVEEVCSRAIIISNGQLVADGTPEEFKSKSASAGSISLTVGEGGLAKMRERLNGFPGMKKVNEKSLGSGQTKFSLYPESKDGSLFALISELKNDESKIISLSVEDGRLDEFFREVTK